MTDLVDSIHDRVSDVIDIEKEDIESEVEAMREYGVTQDDEIERSVLATLAKEHEVDRDDFYENSGGETGDDEDVSVADTTDMGDGEWVALEVTVDELWDPNHESISQTGLIGDETGRTKFTSWADSNTPDLEEGKSYRLDNVVTDEYNGDINIKFTPNTEVEELDDEVEVNTEAESLELVGAFVDIQAGSGLIERCPEDDCTRVLQNRSCSEHGKAEEDVDQDLRIKGVLDDGESAYNIILDQEMTTELTGVTLDDAIEIAEENFDKEAVGEEMREDIVGRYYRVEGPEIGNNLLVEEIERVTETPDTDSLLQKARSM